MATAFNEVISHFQSESMKFADSDVQKIDEAVVSVMKFNDKRSIGPLLWALDDPLRRMPVCFL